MLTLSAMAVGAPTAAAAAPAPEPVNDRASGLRTYGSRYLSYFERGDGRSATLRVVDALGERSSATVFEDLDCYVNPSPHIGLFLETCYPDPHGFAVYRVRRLGTGASTPLPEPGCGGGFYISYSEVGRHWLRGRQQLGIGEGNNRPIYLDWRTGECRTPRGHRDIDRPELPQVPKPGCGDGRTRYRVGRAFGSPPRPLIVRLCGERHARRIRCADECALKSVGTSAVVWREGKNVVKAQLLSGGARYRWRFQDFEHNMNRETLDAADLMGTIYVAVPRRNLERHLYRIRL